MSADLIEMKSPMQFLLRVAKAVGWGRFFVALVAVGITVLGDTPSRDHRESFALVFLLGLWVVLGWTAIDLALCVAALFFFKVKKFPSYSMPILGASIDLLICFGMLWADKITSGA